MDLSNSLTKFPNSTEYYDERKLDFTQFYINNVTQILLLANKLYIMVAFCYHVRLS